MKQRTGFVSNSSSTSFVVVGKKLSASDLEGKGYCDFHSRGTPPHFVGTGRELSDGVDMFRVDSEMFDMVKALVTMGEDFEMYAVALLQCTESEEADISREMMARLELDLVPEHRAEVHKYDLCADNNRAGSTFDFMWRYHREVSDDDDDEWGDDWDYLSDEAHDWIDTYKRLKEL